MSEAGKRAFAVALVPYAAWLVLAYEYHFLDGVNLLFHEAGHLFFTPLGRTMHFLGGTIFQLAFPAACAFHFLRREGYFEAAVACAWLGESVLYMAEYMADARTKALPLVGGGIHDWEWLLSRWGLLERCELLGSFAHAAGSLVIVGAVAWALQLAFAAGGRDEAQAAETARFLERNPELRRP